MTGILERIIERRRLQVPIGAEAVALRRAADALPRGLHRLRSALAAPGINIIAEFKRASPSLGMIRPDARIEEIVRAYAQGGAAAVSILTEPTFFGGSLEDLRVARQITRLPILRKDFTIAESQIDEAAIAGADAVLLIVAALSDEELRRFRFRAEDELGLDALVEVHTADEMKRALACGAKLIGVNNRDLRTFETSLATSADLGSMAPSEVTLVSESGIASSLDIIRLQRRGYRGFLVGEFFMRAGDPRTPLEVLRGNRPAIKVCGITNEEDARLCGSLGVEMVGLNFSPESPRWVSVEKGRQIVEAVRPEWPALRFVGVLVNQQPEIEVDAAQFHGDETAGEMKEAKAPFLIKALRVDGNFKPESAAQFDCDAILLDTHRAGCRGGTGECFDWRLVSEVQKHVPRVIVAGGLTPDNVAEAIRLTRPFAVDVCSGVESAPGRKDPEKLRRFVEAVR